MAIRINDNSNNLTGNLGAAVDGFSVGFSGTASSTPVSNVVGSIQRSLGGFGISFREGVQNAIKWHPGHYVLGDSSSSANLPPDSYLDEAAATSSIKGWCQILRWVDLEPTRDNYTFTAIDDLMSRCASRGLYLWLEIWGIKFGRTNWQNYLPEYLDTDYSPSGIFAGTDSGGSIKSVAKIWRAEIMDRYIALFQQIGSRYDDEQYFEGVSTFELSHGITSSEDPLFDATEQVTQYLRLFQECREGNISRSNITIPANFFSEASTTDWQNLLDGMADYACGGGGPDAIINNGISNFTTGDNYYNGNLGTTNYVNTIPWKLDVQDPELGGKEGTWFPPDLAESAITLKNCTHMAWVRANYTTVTWDNDILPYLQGTPLQTVQTVPSSFPAADTS